MIKRTIYKFEITRTSGNAIKNGIITMYMAKNGQDQLAKLIREVKSKTRSLKINIKKKKNT